MATIKEILAGKGITIDDLEKEYTRILQSYNVRTHTVLSRMRRVCSSKLNFFDRLISLDRHQVYKLDACGRQTAEFVLDLVDRLKRYLTSEQQPVVSPPPIQHSEYQIITSELTKSVDKLSPIFISNLSKYPARVQNVVKALYDYDCHGSLAELYNRVNSPEFRPDELRNLGRKSILDFHDCIKELSALVSSLLSNGEQMAEDMTCHAALVNIGIPDEQASNLIVQSGQIGHFPLFAALQTVIDTFSEKERSIIDTRILLYDGQELASNMEAANQVSNTVERVRQKRNSIIEKLESVMKALHGIHPETQCPYIFEMNEVNRDINATEGTSFSLNFCNWALSFLYSDIAYAGKVHRSLTREKGDFIAAVPRELSDIFDFDSYIAKLDELLPQQRQDDERIDLRALMADFFKTRYPEDYMQNVERSCRSIIFLFYHLDIDYGKVIFKANAYKPAPLVLATILDESTAPLTIDELYYEYLDRCPERDSDPDKLRISTMQSERIGHFAKNPLVDESDSELYFGIKGRTYGDDFLAITLRRGQVRPSEVSLKLVEKFIRENGRYPIPQNREENKEEYDLARCLQYQRKLKESGEIQATSEAILDDIDARYGQLIPSQTSNRRSFEELINVGMDHFNNGAELPDKDKAWIYKTIGKYYAGGLTPRQKTLVEGLLSAMKNSGDEQE